MYPLPYLLILVPLMALPLPFLCFIALTRAETPLTAAGTPAASNGNNAPINPPFAPLPRRIPSLIEYGFNPKDRCLPIFCINVLSDE